MWIEVDLASVPPAVALHEADDLRSFKVVVRLAEHAFVSPQVVRDMAGASAADPDWSGRFEAMLAYAQSKGWVRDDGAIRAHVEAPSPVTPA